MNMPDLDGLETFRRIRALPGPVSRSAGDRDDRRCHARPPRDRYLAQGLDGYLSKPLAQATLRGTNCSA